jgi:hypothetical protein
MSTYRSYVEASRFNSQFMAQHLPIRRFEIERSHGRAHRWESDSFARFDMVGVVLLLLGVFLFLAVVGRIWIDRTPGDSGTNDSVVPINPGTSAIATLASENRDSLA